LLAARRVSTPKAMPSCVKALVGLSSLTRKGPCRWKASAVRKAVTRHGVAAGTDLGVSCPGGPTRRCGAHPKLEREGRHGCQRLAASAAWGEHPHRGSETKLKAMQLTEAEITGVVKRPLPRPRGRSQNLLLRTGRKPCGRTGNQRVRVLVVEKFEWQTSEGRIDGACPACRCKATGRENNRCLALRKPDPREEIS